MRAEVLPLRSARIPNAPDHLLTYAVPDHLAGALEPGQLVSIPMGERTAAGIVWALDASGDLPGESETPPRAMLDVLLPQPLLLQTHRALAEWIADHYAAPLDMAVRLFLPPGLAQGLRSVLRPREGALAGVGTTGGDEAHVLGMLRERGWLERRRVEDALGRQRAGVAIGALVAHEHIALSTELVSRLAAENRIQHTVRLTAAPAALEAWRADARARLADLPQPPKVRPRYRPVEPGEREAERLLRQLTVLDVLSRAAELGHIGGEGWRVEDLRRLTRATQAAMNELVAAGLIAIVEGDTRHDPLAGHAIPTTRPLPLSPAQAGALAEIVGTAPSGAGDSRVILLHGITGSGKTEVYLQALAATISQGRQGVVLVPEIALTPQAMARYAGRFPGRVALLHSALTPAERLDEWRRIRNGGVDVVLGSRSALFAPVERLGLIVVDEEHEAAYKQDRTPTYHARDVAVRLGSLAQATVVLGSATPSVESYWLAQQGNYRLVELRERAPATDGTTERGLPPVSLVDLRAELRGGNTSILSAPLCGAIEETLAHGDQAILFLNRRGTASGVVCRECGHVVKCVHCDVSMTYHAPDDLVICHYCGRREPAPATCPVCWSASIRYFGVGTERVETAVKRQFPAARVLRWDRDTAKTRHAHEELLKAFAERRADVLVGTQMIAKGLDLPGVTLVGVVSADIALFLPDFRASERAFQLLTQVAGRAGRGEVPGRVLVQTFNPDHFCIQASALHDYAAFYAAEISARERFGYPPFRRFVKCTFESSDRYTAQVEAIGLAERLEALIHDWDLPETDLVGPAPAFLERLRGRYRWQLILRSPDPRPLLRALRAEGLPRGWSVEVDPASTL